VALLSRVGLQKSSPVTDSVVTPTILAVRRLESDLIRKWREARGLTQESLGAACPEPLSTRAVAGYEKRGNGDSSIALDNLLNVVRGLAIQGTDDAKRLARFFLGPEPAPSTGRLPAALAVAVDVAMDRGVARETIAGRLGISQSDLALLEGGVLPLSLEQFRTLCELSGLSADEVLKLPVRLPLGVQKRLGEFKERAGVFSESVTSLLDEIERLRANTDQTN
jgi:transcriptional regulator with XRE-family HTH domain